MGGDWKEMFEAAFKGDLELVKYHVKMGVDVNYQHPEFLTTALIEASQYGQAEVVAYLLENGADPDIKSVFGGDTAISVAKAFKKKNVIKVLENHFRKKE